MLEGGIPGHGAGRRNASLPHRAQMEPNVIVYARRNLQLFSTATTLGWARREQRGGVQQRARPWQANNQDLDTGAIDQPAQFAQLSDQSAHPLKPSGEATIGSGHNDKRYRHHQPASRKRAACRYLSLKIQTIQSCTHARNPITTTGATLIRA